MPEKALITNQITNAHIPVMFNPEEYSLDLGNTIAEIGIPGLEKSPVQYVRGNIRTLKMELFFDTYENRTDVRLSTGRISALLEKTTVTQAPPVLLVTWGSLQFQCVLESAGQRFIMFLDDGTPVRARLTVRAGASDDELREVALADASVRNHVAGKTIRKVVIAKGPLVSVVVQ